MNLISGLYNIISTYYGGYEGNKEVGFGKHKDINTVTGEKELITATYLNNIEIEISGIVSFINSLANSFIDLYKQSPLVYYKVISPDLHTYKTVKINTTNLDLNDNMIGIPKIYTYNVNTYTEVNITSVSFTDNIFTININPTETNNMKIVLLSSISDITTYITNSGIFPSGCITLIDTDNNEYIM